MPIYEYACAKCGETIEVIQSMSAAVLEIHEGCGGRLEKLVSRTRMKMGESDGSAGSSDSSMLRFRENSKIAAEKKGQLTRLSGVNLGGPRGGAKAPRRTNEQE